MRRRRKARTKVRRIYLKPKKRSYRRSKGFSGEMNVALSAGLYGAVRAKVSNMLSPYTSKIPLGNVSDEVGMLVTLHLADKFLGRKSKTMRSVFKAGRIIEYARIGEAVTTGQLSLNNNASNNGQLVQTIF